MLCICVNYDVCGCLYVQHKYNIVGTQVLAHTLVETGNGTNRPNTIDLLESGLKNWASSDFYNSYWGLGVWPRTLKTYRWIKILRPRSEV